MDIKDIVGLLGSLDPQEVTDEEFAKYAAHSQALMPRLDDTQKLILYGLYKQASVGNAPEKPGDIDKASPDYYKWQAWRSFVNVSGNDARRLYAYFVSQFQQVSEISSAAKSSGRDIEGVGSSVSTLFVDYSAQESEAFASSPLLRAVYAGNETDLKEILSQSVEKINEKDSAGMTALHYAVDKGLASIVDTLLENGADVNAQDETGQTPLMYAVICSHKEVVEKLLSVPSIDLGIKNTDGETAKDISAGDDDILELLEKKP